MPAHIDTTLAALPEPWFIGAELGEKYARVVREALRSHDANAVDGALALGGYLVHTESNKRERHALRAVLLAQFVLKGQPLAIKEQLRAQYKNHSVDQLKQAFKNLVPAFNDGDKRAEWNPDRFTNAAMLRGLLNPSDWSARPVPPYKLMIHSVRHGSNLLAHPYTITGWTAISCSVLGSTNPRAYTNHGLILRVPANNILTASHTDQWFDNYAGTDRSTKAQDQSMAQHVADKNLRLGSLLSPDDVVRLQGTNGAESIDRMAGTTLTEHNEVIVCGRSGQHLPHGRTGPLLVVGYFLQTRMDGTLPDVLMKSQGPSDLIRVAIADAARQNFLPLYYLPNPHLR